ncbi:DNA polymerase III subunit delta [Listeria booriae]|uniref:DNA polymerase III subunit delta n=1 Tax=Listeria booriae TaxID=1552123 RepID=A0A842D1J1_9LIST|nr:DNA polymerase III subunit delta [Listeria booriae]MBC1293127.1 DNA polymerase III subunit delta [Listeria booriae]MBC1335949.1 DNA polymerase III subunit delta [Listeria booriae]MBC1650206.1 DNA polymerase III subunit delta [Listeria booriae]MBC2004712.1 DNA polymerase III subunit delta [Listeria booriae]MBC6163369.1 DNA polymerase III subunit delta [Listeria booriae]
MIAEWKKIEKKQFAPIYLIIGTEDYIINETKKRLVANILDTEDTDFNYANFDLDETAIEQVIEEAETIPFFGDRRLIVASNPSFLTTEKTKSKIEHRTARFEDYLNEPVDYSILVIIARVEKLDERKKLTKLLKKQATIVDAKRPNDAELRKWVQSAIKNNDFSMEIPAIERLMELTGGQLTTAMNELDKLMLYKLESREISVADVESLVVRSLEQNIFLLLDKMIALDIGGALSIYYDLLKQKEEPIKILALIASQFRLLTQIKLLEKQGFSQQQVAQKLKVHPFRVKIGARQAKSFSYEQLTATLERLAEMDFEMKTGYGDKAQKLEWFLFSLQDQRVK